MSIEPWVARTNPTRDGEDVKALVANRFPAELQRRTQHLKDRLDALAAGESIGRLAAPASSTVFVGAAVYWNGDNQRYEPALSALSADPVSGGWVLAPSGFVAGICTAKPTSTSADIVFKGLVRGLDFTAAIGSAGDTADEAGAYYLSGTAAGKYVKRKPPVSVSVLVLYGDGTACVDAQTRENLESHIHYSFDLTAQPAGSVTCPAMGERYTFILADTAQPGWLPADDASFLDRAPAGAKFGYNLEAHPALQLVWPPLPLSGAYIEKDGVGVDPAVFLVDGFGLWWMDDCYGLAPWPADPENCAGSSESFDPDDCTPVGDLTDDGYVRHPQTRSRLRLWYTRMAFKTDASVVTSLRPKTGSPVSITRCSSGEDAVTGDLCADVDLSLSLTENEPGYQALKGIDGLKFKRGPVLTGLKAGSNIEITPVTGKGALDGDTYRGDVLIDALVGADETRQGQPEIYILGGARLDDDDGVFFLNLPAGLDTNMSLRISVPLSGLPANPVLELQVWLLARISALPLPPLQVAYRRIVRPTAACGVGTVPDTDTSLADLVPSACGSLDAGEFVELTTGSFAVAAGDQAFIKLSRAGSTDAYAGDVGLLRAAWRIRSSA